MTLRKYSQVHSTEFVDETTVVLLYGELQLKTAQSFGEISMHMFGTIQWYGSV